MRLDLRYCATQDCPQDRWFSFNEPYCSMCRQETAPCIQCLCGEEEYHPKQKRAQVVCAKCGTRWTPEHLAACLSAQLKGMVSEIAEKFNALP